MSGERAVGEDRQDVAGGLPSERSATPKTLCDTDVSNVRCGLPRENSARMGGGSNRCVTTETLEPIHAPSMPLSESEDLTILPSSAGLTDQERRETLISQLKKARRRLDSARSHRIELISAARDIEMSLHDIGIPLGITGNAVRGLIERAKPGDS